MLIDVTSHEIVLFNVFTMRMIWPLPLMICCEQLRESIKTMMASRVFKASVLPFVITIQEKEIDRKSEADLEDNSPKDTTMQDTEEIVSEDRAR